MSMKMLLMLTRMKKNEELKEELAKSSDPAAQKFLSLCDGHMDELLNDPDERVRGYVAMFDYKTDILVNDSSPYVRQQLAKNCCYLNVLVDDEDPEVRRIAREKMKSILEGNQCCDSNIIDN